MIKRLLPVLGGLLGLWLLRRIFKRRKARKAAKKQVKEIAN